MRIDINGRDFTLHASGAIFWEDEKILLISDVHLGKVAHFRKHGLAIPQGAIAENFKRLDEVVLLFNPVKIIFLGDLFHSIINKEWQLFAYWVSSIGAEILLVEGNHDIISKLNYADLNIAMHPQLEIGQFLLTHHPTDVEGFFNFCGHIHPAIRLRGVGRQSVKLACFFRTKNQLVLPAFGEFTGTFLLRPEPEDVVYAIVNEEVMRVV